ncbi:glutamine-hydrolyzing carbamoyl-phosphate synthase small subunit [Tepidibacter formicigenes]|jgi:carbamoyl-phosphate synthase small subunit|uniref:Carbamoyl phosphate synthase small chain n=1 Tax=Tepidibacter formicigenes DSM 15518 TaxID=1123349 RepID=A0A1M6SXQ3_9FIRM|nr:glutamine-hydrolyzing carbamoyl-phosphate synthase small subunit [Tepidibacter formicigenes]SHK49501.1 carbamoyl-phosphate synthase small subunit [Tepidibacter formicigenes DSM 15518]
MESILYLEDGSIYKGKAFGKIGTTVGELVFNTSMTGYQEILTDPSYAGQIINMTYPLIGNYGVNNLENESSKIHAKGFIVKNISNQAFNYMSEKNIDDMLKGMDIVGIYGVDTRSITKKIRNSGVLKCVISSENLSIDELKNILDKTEIKDDYMKKVSTKEIINIPGDGLRVALIDFGVKQNIINNLKQRECDITIFPYNASYEEIMSINPDGVLLSNGPGDPKEVKEAIETSKKLIKNIPTMGICLGHQIIALAVGANTYKMKYGHRGGNHGVYDIERDRSFITSQNHGYAVDANSIKDKEFIVTHINLNDNTVEGMRHKNLPVFSVQYHPEGSPGPQDSSYIFDKFISMLGGEK